MEDVPEIKETVIDVADLVFRLENTVGNMVNDDLNGLTKKPEYKKQCPCGAGKTYNKCECK